MTEHIKCLIIGSGPAGYTAAIYASRADLKPVLYTGILMGGQLTQTTEVENYPGYPDGINGPQMMENFRRQAERLGTDIRFGYVTSVDFSETPHRVVIDKVTTILADSVIIATGASAKWLGLPSEQKYNGFGVSACAICDGFFFRGQDIAIIGVGDTAAEEALYLSKLCNKVHMLIRADDFRASKAMAQRVLSTPNIIVYYQTEVCEILGNEFNVNAVQIFNNQTGVERILDVTGVFIAIGHQPNTEIFKGWLNMDETGYILTKPGSAHTNIEGVFCCGDAQDHVYRQAVTAAGSGCMAAIDAERFLANKSILSKYPIVSVEELVTNII